MPSIVACPHCSQKLSLQPQHLGVTVRCSSCQKTFVAQAPAASPPLAQVVPSAPPPPPPPPPAPARRAADLSPDDFGAAFNSVVSRSGDADPEEGVTATPRDRSRSAATDPNEFDDDRPSKRRGSRGKAPSGNSQAGKTIGGIVATVVGIVVFFLIKMWMSGPTSISDSQWKEFSPPGGECKLLMPGTPEPKQVPNPAGGMISAYQVQLKKEDCIFSIAYSRLPFGDMKEIPHDAIFNGARQGIQEAIPGIKFLKERDLLTQGHKTRELVFDIKGKGKLTVRMIVTEDMLYELQAGGSKFEPDTDSVVKYFASFKITGAQPPMEERPDPRRDDGPRRDGKDDRKDDPFRDGPGRDAPRRDDRPPRDDVNRDSPRDPREGNRFPLELRATFGKGGDPMVGDPMSGGLVFMEDGQTVLVARPGTTSGRAELHRTTEPVPRSTQPLPGSSLTVSRSAEGKTAVLADSRGGLYLHQTPTLRQLKVLRPPREGPERRASETAVSPDGKFLAETSLTELILWDLDTGKPRVTRKFQGDPLTRPPLVGFSPNGSLLATSHGTGGVQLRDPITGEEESLILADAAVAAMAFSPDGKLLAMTNGKAEVRLWDLEQFHSRERLQSSLGNVLTVAFAPDGRSILAGAEKGILAWELEPRRVIFAFSTEQGPVTSVAFSGPGSQLATSGNDGTVRVWNTASFVQPFSIRPTEKKDPRLRFDLAMTNNPKRVVLSADGRTLAGWSDTDYLKRWGVSERATDAKQPRATHSGQMAFLTEGKVLAKIGGFIEVWEPNGQRHRMTEPETHHLAASPDGTTVALTTKTGLRLYRFPGFKELPALPESSLGLGPLVFSPDGNLLACVAKGNTIQLWDLKARRTKWVAEFPPQPRPGFREATEMALAFSADGKTLYSQDNYPLIRFWDVADGELRLTLPLDTFPSAMAVASHEPLLAVRLQKGGLLFLDGNNGAPRGTLAVSDLNWPLPDSLTFSHDGKVLFIGGHTTRVEGWRLSHVLTPAGEAPEAKRPALPEVKLTDELAKAGVARIPIQRRPSSAGILAFSPDGRTLACPDVERGLVSLWNLTSGSLQARFPAEFAPNALAWSPDGKLLACGSHDTIRIRDAQSGRIARSFDLKSPLEESVQQFAWSPDGKALLVRTARLNRLLDLSSPDEIREKPGAPNAPGFVVFSKDGKECQVGDWNNPGKGWDGKLLENMAPPLNLFGERGRVSPATGTMAIHQGNQVQLASLRTGKTLGMIQNTNRLTSVALSPDGRLLATTEFDGAVRLWNPTTLTARAILKAEMRAPVMGVAFSPDGKLLATARGESVQLWQLDEKNQAIQWLKPPPAPKALVRDLGGNIQSLTFADQGRKGFAMVRLPNPGGFRGELRRFDVATAKEEPLLKEGKVQGSQFAVSPDGKLVAVSRSGLVSCWEVGSDKPARTHRTGIATRSSELIEFAPDNRTLLTAGGNTRTSHIVLWDAVDGMEKRRIGNVPGQPCLLRLSEDGKTLTALLTKVDRSIPWVHLQTWDLVSGKPTSHPAHNISASRSTVLSPDGRFVPSIGTVLVDVRDMHTNRVTSSWNIDRPAVQFTQPAYSPDGKTLYAGTFDGGAIAWDMATGKERFFVTGLHAAAVRALAVSPDGKTLLTGGDDQTVKVWDVAELSRQ